jgi:serine/threonine protein phosphatase PrpC
MRLEISVLSKPGGRAINEDAFGFWASKGICFCVVCDGAGGQGGGDVASKLAVSATLAWFQATPECSARAIAGALASANEAVMQQQGSESRLATMRATAVVLSVDANRKHALWSHLGDSRLYCFRGGRVVAQTKDHSVVQNMVDAGYLKECDLRTAQERSRLFAALGQVENFEPRPGPGGFAIAAGDAFLLCTDGFWEYVEEQEMADALDGAASGEDWLRRMERRVTERGGERQDNYSALAVWCSESAPDDDSPNGDPTESPVPEGTP